MLLRQILWIEATFFTSNVNGLSEISLFGDDLNSTLVENDELELCKFRSENHLFNNMESKLIHIKEGLSSYLNKKT